MSAKLLINGKSGSGKSSLIENLRNAFVISRDGKAFPFEMPHMLISSYHTMSTIIHGGTAVVDDEEIEIEGVFQKVEKFEDKYGDLPEIVVIDSVSKLIQDAIDYANLNFAGFDVHSTINKEIAVLTSFVQEDLVANGINVVLINHVMDNDKKGLVPIGQGKFKDKGGFYGEVDHSILIDNFKVTHRGVASQARTTLADMPDYQYVANTINPSKSKKLKDGEEYYDLQKHIDLINSVQTDNKKWSL